MNCSWCIGELLPESLESGAGRSGPADLAADFQGTHSSSETWGLLASVSELASREDKAQATEPLPATSQGCHW